MNRNSTIGRVIRIVSVGHVVFAATMITFGIMGLAKGKFTQIWLPVPRWVPAQTALTYLCAAISLGCGIGLLWRRTAAIASRILLMTFLVWLLVLRLPYLFIQSPLVLVAWSCGSTAVMLAAAWVLYVWFAGERDSHRFAFITGDNGLRIARALYGLALIPFGLAHFMYLKQTTVLIPGWLPWHVGWAYFTGATFIAAGVAMIISVCARLAAALSALQMGLFLLIVWIPFMWIGGLSDFQWGEVAANCALLAAAWVVADSYRDMPWLAFNKPWRRLAFARVN
jgi:uncharacterized membrane protein